MIHNTYAFICDNIYRHISYFYILHFVNNCIYFAGLIERVSSRISKDTVNAFERRRSTILAKRKKTQVQESYDIYDDADNLRRLSKNQISYLQARNSSSASQFQYNNPGFRQDENI